MPNLEPLDPDSWDASIDHLKGGFAERLNVYRTMAHHPDLLAAWAPLRHHVVVDNALGPERTEVIILRAASHLRSDYEKAHHIVRGRACGLSDDRIAAILEMDEVTNRHDSLLALAVDELVVQNALSRPTRGRLVEEFGVQGSLDLIAIVGFYTTLGLMLNSFETPIDNDLVEALRLRPLMPG